MKPEKANKNPEGISTTLNEMTKKIIFKIARSNLSSNIIGRIFENFSWWIPISKIISNKYIVAFEHPVKFWQNHYLIVPKKNIKSFTELDLKNEKSNDSIFLLEILNAAQILAKKYKLKKNIGNYSLLVNGGKYQDIPQMHFHLAAGKAKAGNGFVQNSYRPLCGDLISREKSCEIFKNRSPQREIDYIIIVQAGKIISFENLDLKSNEKNIVNAFRKIQKFLIEIALPAYTLTITESDIQNSGKFIVRILSGKMK